MPVRAGDRRWGWIRRCWYNSCPITTSVDVWKIWWFGLSPNQICDSRSLMHRSPVSRSMCESQGPRPVRPFTVARRRRVGFGRPAARRSATCARSAPRRCPRSSARLRSRRATAAAPLPTGPFTVRHHPRTGPVRTFLPPFRPRPPRGRGGRVPHDEHIALPQGAQAAVESRPVVRCDTVCLRPPLRSRCARSRRRSRCPPSGRRASSSSATRARRFAAHPRGCPRSTGTP